MVRQAGLNCFNDAGAACEASRLKGIHTMKQSTMIVLALVAIAVLYIMKQPSGAPASEKVLSPNSGSGPAGAPPDLFTSILNSVNIVTRAIKSIADVIPRNV